MSTSTTVEAEGARLRTCRGFVSSASVLLTACLLVSACTDASSSPAESADVTPVAETSVVQETTGPATAQLADSSAATQGTLIRVEIQPCTGLGRQRATALAVGPDVALTAAHSFQTAESASLRYTDGNGREVTVEARLEVSDLDKDIAIIRPTTSLELPWKAFVLGEPEIGETVTVETYADADGPETKQAEVLRLVNATLDGEGRRAAVELEADIDPGDSGAPVLSANGRAIGMIFASSRTSERGWAVRSNELAEAVDAHQVESTTTDLAESGSQDDGFRCPERG